MKESLSDHFKMKDLGSVEYLLGVEIRRRSGGGYFLVQEKYAQEVVREFGMGEAKVASTPFEHRSEMGLSEASSSDGERSPAWMADIPYRRVVGSLMYLIVCTRPDLSMAVSALSRYCQAPQLEQWEAAKKVLRYVKGTVGEGLGYSLGEDLAVWGYSDASYGNDKETKKGRIYFLECWCYSELG